MSTYITKFFINFIFNGFKIFPLMEASSFIYPSPLSWVFMLLISYWRVQLGLEKGLIWELQTFHL